MLLEKGAFCIFVMQYTKQDFTGLWMHKIHSIIPTIESRGRIIMWNAGNSKKGKRFGPCQPARIAQADMGRYFLQMH